MPDNDRYATEPKVASGSDVERLVAKSVSDLRSWCRAAGESLGDDVTPEAMADVVGLVVDAILDRDYALLETLNRALLPYAGSLADQLERLKVPAGCWQAAELGGLMAVIGAGLVQLELVRPEEAIKRITHGERILRALQLFGASVTLDTIAGYVQEQSGESHRMAPATISRLLTALEAAGFVRRTGMTNARRFLLLEAGEQLLGQGPTTQPGAGEQSSIAGRGQDRSESIQSGPSDSNDLFGTSPENKNVSQARGTETPQAEGAGSEDDANEILIVPSDRSFFNAFYNETSSQKLQ